MGVMAGRFNVEEAGIAVFAEAFPLEKIREILKATGREGKRKRQLPAAMMVYYVIALGLFVSVGCREVLRRLLDGPMWIWPEQIRVATESAITQARQRLGAAPIERLYREQVVPIAKKITRGAWFRRWRVVTLDGSTLDVADSDKNAAAFGRPGASRGRSAYPQTRVVGFVENGTHVVFGAEMDRYQVGEVTMARRILLPAFAPKPIDAYEPYTRALCNELLDATTGKSEFDAALDYAQDIPLRVIARSAQTVAQ